MELVIVIDDDVDFLKGLRNHLTGRRMRVVATTSPRRGIELSRTGNPDLILLGLKLSGLNGLEVMKDLKSDEITKHIPVVMLVQNPKKEELLAGRQLGAFDFLVKPCDTETLLAKIDKGLAAAREREAAHEEHKVEPIKLTRSSGRALISFPGGINRQALQAVNGLFTPELRRELDEGIIIFDLRNQIEISTDQLKLVKNILDLLRGLITAVVAGKHYGQLLAENFDERTNLFMSAEELKQYLEMIEK